MATTFDKIVPARGDEARFCFRLACAMALLLTAGFSFQLAAGRSSFAVPLIYHVHAAVFFGWVVLFLAQTWLAAAGNFQFHRQLGRLAAIWVPAMVIAGTMLTVTSMQRTGGPFFFDASEFLIGNPAGILAFALTVGAAVMLRRRTDWHSRLMLCAMAGITGPGFGRLLPMPLLVPWSWEISSSAGLVFIAAGMVRDYRRAGRIHPAWFVGIAVTIGWIALGEGVAQTPWAIELTHAVMAGHPGAARPMEAYLP
ncbi:hypothetical protein [Novosphingobium sp.]|uniref:hypothetical protein n=1 Tax=Novosphingobium sp. TaxID=1874826 RepID=UPI0035B0CF04